MEKEFESALEELLKMEVVDEQSANKYNSLFKQMITASMQIVGATDYASLVSQKVEATEKKFGVKMAASEDENDFYRKLRDVVRFEMSREAILADQEYEICCTESNYKNALGKFRDDLEKIVPQGQQEVVESIAQSLYSDFTNFFVSTTLDMIADARIFQIKEFRPLQLNALGKEIRTYANIIKQQNAKPQKSETVTGWFRTMFVLPAFLFKNLYAVDMSGIFEVPQKYMDDAAHLFNIFQRNMEGFAAGDEYKILAFFLADMGLSSCFTVRPKKACGNSSATNKPVIN